MSSDVLLIPFGYGEEYCVVNDRAKAFVGTDIVRLQKDRLDSIMRGGCMIDLGHRCCVYNDKIKVRTVKYGKLLLDKTLKSLITQGKVKVIVADSNKAEIRILSSHNSLYIEAPSKKVTSIESISEYEVYKVIQMVQLYDIMAEQYINDSRMEILSETIIDRDIVESHIWRSVKYKNRAGGNKQLVATSSIVKRKEREGLVDTIRRWNAELAQGNLLMHCTDYEYYVNVSKEFVKHAINKIEKAGGIK